MASGVALMDWEPDVPGQFDTPHRLRRKRPAEALEPALDDQLRFAASPPPSQQKSRYAQQTAGLLSIIIQISFRIVERLFSLPIVQFKLSRRRLQATANSQEIVEERRLSTDGSESIKRRLANIKRPIMNTLSPTHSSRRQTPRSASTPTRSRRFPSMAKPSLSPSSTHVSSLSIPTSTIQAGPFLEQAPIPTRLGVLDTDQALQTTGFPSTSHVNNSQTSRPEADIISRIRTSLEPPALPGERSRAEPKLLTYPQPIKTRAEPKQKLLLWPTHNKQDTKRGEERGKKLLRVERRSIASEPRMSFESERSTVPSMEKKVRIAVNPHSGLPQTRVVKFFKESMVGEWAPSSPWSNDQVSDAQSDLNSNLSALLQDTASPLPPATPPKSTMPSPHRVLSVISTTESRQSGDDLKTIKLSSVMNGETLKTTDEVRLNPSPAYSAETKGSMKSDEIKSEGSPITPAADEIVDMFLDLAMSGSMKDKRVTRKKRRDEAKAARKAAEEAAARKAKEEAERKRTQRRMPKQKFIRALSEEWESRIEEAMRKGENVPLTTTVTGTELRRKDLMTVLGQREWLNDEIINAYLEWIVEYANEKAGKNGRTSIPKVIAHNSFFYKKIATEGPKSVSRWMKRKRAEGKKLLEVEQVLIPVNNASHWTLLVVSPKTRTVEYLDSFSGSSKVFINNTLTWLQSELGDAWHAEEWRVLDTRSAQQFNGYDCGVFTITNAECVAGSILTDSYDANDMAAARRRIAAVLLNRGFGGDLVAGEDL